MDYHDIMRADVRELAQACIHCLVSRLGDIIPRPLVTALNGQRPNEVVHTDFQYIGDAKMRDLKYILVIRDFISSYSWLPPYDTADSDAATIALSGWIA